MITDKVQAANDFVASMNVYKKSEAYTSLPKEQQLDVDKQIDNYVSAMQTGITFDFVDGQTVMKDAATGVTLGLGSVFDKSGSKYYKDSTGNVVSTDKDGTTTTYQSTTNDKGETTWTSTKLVPVDNEILNRLDGNALTPNEVVFSSEGASYTVSPDGKSVVRHSKSGGMSTTYNVDPATGKFVESVTEPVNEANLAYVNKANGTVDNTAELGSLGIKIPAGVQAGGGFVQNGQYYMSDGESASMLRFNQPSEDNIGAILDVASDPKAKASVEKALGNVNFELSNAQSDAVRGFIMDGKLDVSTLKPEQLKRLGISSYTNGNYGGAEDMWSGSDTGDIAYINGVPYEVSGKSQDTKSSGGYNYYYHTTTLKPIGDGKWITVTAESVGGKGSGTSSYIQTTGG